MTAIWSAENRYRILVTSARRSNQAFNLHRPPPPWTSGTVPLGHRCPAEIM